MIASAIQPAQRQTTKASATILAGVKEATAHVQVAGHTVVAIEPLSRDCIVEEVKAGGGSSMDDAVSVEVPWKQTGGGF